MTCVDSIRITIVSRASDAIRLFLRLPVVPVADFHSMSLCCQGWSWSIQILSEGQPLVLQG